SAERQSKLGPVPSVFGGRAGPPPPGPPVVRPPEPSTGVRALSSPMPEWRSRRAPGPLGELGVKALLGWRGSPLVVEGAPSMGPAREVTGGVYGLPVVGTGLRSEDEGISPSSGTTGAVFLLNGRVRLSGSGAAPVMSSWARADLLTLCRSAGAEIS